MAEKSIDDWIELLSDRSKLGDIGEYFHREQCAELLKFLNELKRRRADDGDQLGDKLWVTDKCGTRGFIVF